MNNTNEDVQIYGKLVNVSTEGIVTDATSVWSEKYKKTVEDVIKDINNKVDDFRANPEFDKATFHGDVLFEGNTTVEGNTTTNGDSTVNGNQDINGILNVYNKIKAHGNPIGLEVDHRIVCNDLTVNGVFRALQLDCNTLTAHNLIKNEGDLRVDGDTILNNVTINGTLDAQHASTQKFGMVRLAEDLQDPDGTDVATIGIIQDLSRNFLPKGEEGQVLVFKNGKWVADDALQQINNNVNQTISNLKTEVNNIKADLTEQFNTLKTDLTNQFNTFKQELLGSQYWEVNSSDEVVPKNDRSVRARHFYKNA